MSTAEQVSFPAPMTPDGLPDPYLRALARDHPVISVAGPGPGGAWLVAGRDAVLEVLSDPERFTSVVDAGVTDARAKAGVSMVGMDPPDHTRVRKLAGKAFTARRVQLLVPGIERVTGDLLDGMEKGGPPADLITSLSVPLPLRVMCHMLDLPAEDEADFLAWSDVFTGMNSYTMDEIAAATDHLRSYMASLAGQRRRQLGDDVLSSLIRARDGEDALTEEELLATMVLLLVAGHQTTVRAISRTVLLLLRTGSWQALVSGQLPPDRVVEESLRHQTPIDTALFRTARVDTQLAGAHIKAGDPVFISVQLANFDETAWPEPATFDPARPDLQHLAFGHGVHFCLGAPLARVELRVALTGLAARFPALRLNSGAQDLDWTTGSWLNGPTALPVTW
ncbi:MAG: cytochrome P450 [Actinobacteria bacterium]|nr:cytochrome P450 [Actinomycetota bacterium]